MTEMPAGVQKLFAATGSGVFFTKVRGNIVGFFVVVSIRCRKMTVFSFYKVTAAFSTSIFENRPLQMGNVFIIFRLYPASMTFNQQALAS